MSLSHWYGNTKIDSKNLENVFENLENSQNIFAEITIAGLYLSFVLMRPKGGTFLEMHRTVRSVSVLI